MPELPARGHTQIDNLYKGRVDACGLCDAIPEFSLRRFVRLKGVEVHFEGGDQWCTGDLQVSKLVTACFLGSGSQCHAEVACEQVQGLGFVDWSHIATVGEYTKLSIAVAPGNQGVEHRNREVGHVHGGRHVREFQRGAGDPAEVVRLVRIEEPNPGIFTHISTEREHHAHRRHGPLN